MSQGWIGVDLDGTLARSDRPWDGSVGNPVETMLARVKDWLAMGVEVRIMTARVGRGGYSEFSQRWADDAFIVEQKAIINAWCLKHLGQILPVTCEKDFMMIELWDDRAVQIIPNTGLRADGGK